MADQVIEAVTVRSSAERNPIAWRRDHVGRGPLLAQGAMHLTMHHMGAEYAYPLTRQDVSAGICANHIKNSFDVSFLNFSSHVCRSHSSDCQSRSGCTGSSGFQAARPLTPLVLRPWLVGGNHRVSAQRLELGQLLEHRCHVAVAARGALGVQRKSARGRILSAPP